MNATITIPKREPRIYKRPEIVDRTLRFAVSIVRLAGQLPNHGLGQMFSRQIARCGSSVGANVEEAQGSSSKKEFTRRMNIARSEARETLYWLRLLAATEQLPKARLADLVRESNELVSILTAIVKSSKGN